MAYLEDYREDEQRLAQQTSGPGTSYAPAAAGSAPSAAPASSGMTPAPIAAYFSANAPAAQGMGEAMGERVEAAGREAVQSWDAGKAADAWARADRLGSNEGLASELSDAYQDPQYTGGMGRLDAYLATRASTPGQFDELRARFSSLDPSEIGSAAPTAPTMRDVGPEPEARGMVWSGMEGHKKLEAPKPWDRKYDEYKDWETEHNAWQEQQKGAQSEYDESMKRYGEDKDAWEKKRQPFLDAFGL